jgi:L-amino acid N-acyltransferase YncA
MTTLRLANPADFVAIAALTNHYITTTTIHFGYEPVTAAELARQHDEHAALYPWLVADAAGVVVGYAKAGGFRSRPAYRWCTETGIYLQPAHCGRGLGRQLYARLLAVLRAQGFHAAIGGIALPNPASVRLHEALGFRQVGVVARAGRKFERWHDLGFWQLLLRPADHAPTPLLPPALGFAASAGD